MPTGTCEGGEVPKGMTHGSHSVLRGPTTTTRRVGVGIIVHAAQTEPSTPGMRPTVRVGFSDPMALPGGRMPTLTANRPHPYSQTVRSALELHTLT